MNVERRSHEERPSNQRRLMIAALEERPAKIFTKWLQQVSLRDGTGSLPEVFAKGKEWS